MGAIDEIRPEEVDKREIVGWVDGCPVYHVSTTGGYNMVFVLRHGKLEPLSTGTHDRIALGLAKKREPGIQFLSMEKSEHDLLDQDAAVAKRYEELTDHLRALRGFR